MEGVTAWAFGAAGLGADTGVAVAVVYGVLSFVASLPGAAILLRRWYASVRTRTATAPAGLPSAGLPADGPEPADRPPARAAPTGPGRGSAPGYCRPGAGVSGATYGSKDSARLASSSLSLFRRTQGRTADDADSV